MQCNTNFQTTESHKPQQTPKTRPQKTSTKQTTSSTEGDWGLDDWGSFDDAPNSNPPASTKSKGPTGTSSVSEGWDDNDWGSLEEPASKPENPAWNEWSEDWGSKGMSKVELAKKKREEKKQQRLQAMKEKKAAGRGPAKLGAVKMQ